MVVLHYGMSLFTLRNVAGDIMVYDEIMAWDHGVSIQFEHPKQGTM